MSEYLSTDPSHRAADLSALDTTPERQSGRKAQISNITAAKVG